MQSNGRDLIGEEMVGSGHSSLRIDSVLKSVNPAFR
jgi:hypothetical protein